MHDVLLLRRHIVTLACVPSLVWACGQGEAPPSSVSPRTPDPATRAQPNDAAPESAPRDRFAPIAGDPPYIEGYDPEEEHCPAGNWCGSPEHASRLAVAHATEPREQGTCPTRLSGSLARTFANADKKPFEGLSLAPNMQATLNRHGTELKRASSSEDVCCYHWFEYCSGRPYVASTGPQQARLLNAAGLPVHAEALARAWEDDAKAEHASIASFNRAALELLAVGAPLALVAQTQRAALDEVEHAQLCLKLAQRFGSDAHAFAPLQALPARSASLARLARDTLLEGVVAETVASLVATRALRLTTCPHVRHALERIAHDESKHAALALQVVDHCVRNASDARAVVTTTMATLPAHVHSSPNESVGYPEYGRLCAREHQAAWHDALEGIVRPNVEALLS